VTVTIDLPILAFLNIRRSARLYNEMTQMSSAIIRGHQAPMEYAKLCMSMRLATPAIRQIRVCSSSRAPAGRPLLSGLGPPGPRRSRGM